MQTLTLYTNPNSRGRVVRWLLEELKVPYQIKVLEYGADMKSADFLALNPMGKVPVITHGDVVVTEAAAICAYLADHFADKQLAPATNSPMRATYYRWLFFAAGPVEMATSAKAYDWRIDAENAPAVGSGFYQNTVDALETALQHGPYLCGEQFTAADVYVGSQIIWGMMFKTLEERPAFTQYSERLQAREAAIRANQLDDALQA
ncbi:glutathione S-transferase family protein [Alkalimonas collagenimarina]|uniref:Glutathione S-transferase family protein n=1 Tax=Alkalimonas collagenimarina TaxID=400390 RepID=A0ABT9GUN9_9GAMM|nr:glutathione S-transferase family protein [Alkalimonas collagenimarina]MDP4534768.1 glutathione S-transferase family protein [Alkalimonas collagenimarina]